MPINKIVATKRGKSAIAGAMLAAVLAAGGSYFTEPERPAAVILATDTLIKPWEGLVLKSHWDTYAKIYDICYGETRLDGKPVQPGVTKTKAECDAILEARVKRDYYEPLVREVPGFTRFPVSVQASMISGAYNFGVGSRKNKTGMAGSKAAEFHMAGQYRKGCEAQTAWNKAGGQVVNGLVKRREMGDAQRAGEAEVCVSGLNG